VSENRVLRRIFIPKREEVRGDWRRLHNEELHNLYASPIIIIMIFIIIRAIKIKDKMGGACSTHGRYDKCIRYDSKEGTT
jgi:hypothetical protein